MSLIQSIRQKLGLSVTPANNFTWDASADNGTVRFYRGNPGAPIKDLLTVSANDVITGGSGAVLTANGPAFSAYQSVSQSITNVAVNLIFGTEEFDTNNNYDPVTGIFTATVAGIYRFNGGLVINGASGQITLTLIKNGQGYKVIGNALSASGQTVYGTGLVQLAVNDTVRLQGSSATTQTSATGIPQTYFQGEMVRGV